MLVHIAYCDIVNEQPYTCIYERETETSGEYPVQCHIAGEIDGGDHIVDRNARADDPVDKSKDKIADHSSADLVLVP